MKRHFVTLFFALVALMFVVLADIADRTLASVVFIMFAIMAIFLAWFFEYGNIRD